MHQSAKYHKIKQISCFLQKNIIIHIHDLKRKKHQGIIEQQINARLLVSLPRNRNTYKVLMAIYHLSVKNGKQYGSTGTRGQNHFAYINREGKYSRDDIDSFETVNLPAWAEDAKHFWKSADKNERINGRIYKELEISLPRELDAEQRVELVKDFMEKTLGDKFTYSYAIHVPLASDGMQNPHVHVMFSERKLDGIERDEVQFFKRYNAKNPEKGGAQKDRYFNSKIFVSDVRMEWANHVNDYMEKMGLESRIDHRSYKEQGLELSSQNFRAEYVSNHKYMIDEKIKDVRRRNGDVIIERPSEAIRALTANQSVFTMKELDRFLINHTDGEEQYLKAYEAVLTSKDLAMLYGKDKVVLSSNELVSIEDSISVMVYNANQESRIQKPIKLIDRLPSEALRISGERTFEPEQREAFFTLTSTDKISFLNGAAGTGKSYVLSAVSEAFKESDYKVYGIALQAITAKAIAKDCDIPSSTIASFLARHESGNLNIDDKTVLILDEAGMVGSRDMQKLLMIVEKNNAQIKLVGDSYQLNAVSAGSVFSHIQQTLDSKNIASLDKIQRQKNNPDMIAASNLLAKHQVASALDIYKKIGSVNEYESHELALVKTIKSWSEDKSESKLILAHTNTDVNELNNMARAILINQGKLSADSQTLKNYQGDIDIAKDEKIVFKQNNATLGVSNGEIARVVGFEKNDNNKINVLMVQSENTGKFIRVNLDEYNHFKYGYANTIHSSQGMTVDSAYVLASQHMNANLSYVAMTRHRNNLEINYSAMNFATNEKEFVRGADGKISYDEKFNPVEKEITPFDNLKKVLGRSEVKEFSTDYSVVVAKDELLKDYLQNHRQHLTDKRELYDVNSKLYGLLAPDNQFSEKEVIEEVRNNLRAKSILGDELVKLGNELHIAKGELLKLDIDTDVKMGMFKKETLPKGIELQVMDAYKVKDIPVMKVKAKHGVFEIPFRDLKVSYSTKYMTHFKHETKGRLDQRYKIQVYGQMKQQLSSQRNNAPSQNLNAPNSSIKVPKDSTPKI